MVSLDWACWGLPMKGKSCGMVSRMSVRERAPAGKLEERCK